MKTIVFSLFLAVFLIILGASNIFACVCVLPEHKNLKKQVKENFKESTAVFSGKVIEIIKESKVFSVKVKFKSQNTYKGKFINEVIISTGQGKGDCGYNFEVGKDYLIYAYGEVNDLETNICTRTALLESNGDLEILNKIKKPRKLNLLQNNLRNSIIGRVRH